LFLKQHQRVTMAEVAEGPEVPEHTARRIPVTV
jgi:hypothetical protein